MLHKKIKVIIFKVKNESNSRVVRVAKEKWNYGIEVEENGMWAGIDVSK